MSVVCEGLVSGPFRVRSWFLIRRWLEFAFCAVGAVVLGGYFLADRLGELSRIAHDQEVWRADGPEVTAEVTGRARRIKLLFSSNDLEVAYQAPDGSQHRHKLHVTLLGEGLDLGASNSVRLSPENAGDFALGPVVEASERRRSAALVELATVGVLTPLLAWGAWLARKRLVSTERAAAGGKLMLTRLISRRAELHKGRRVGIEIARIAVERPGKELVEVELRLTTRGDDLLTTKLGDQVLALVDERVPLVAIPMTESFYPLELDLATRERARALVGRALLQGNVAPRRREGEKGRA
jgi:hypothetical protein